LFFVHPKDPGSTESNVDGNRAFEIPGGPELKEKGI